MGIFDKFKKGFQKSASAFSSGLKEIIVKKEIDDENLNKIEEFLIQSDVGIEAASEIKKIISTKKIDPNKDLTAEINLILNEYIVSLMKPLENSSFFMKKEKLNATLISGVNGVGKTTSIGKISKILKTNGNKVMLAASDTFRAAAIEQLENWANKIEEFLIQSDVGVEVASEIKEIISSKKIDPNKDLKKEINFILKEYITSLMKPLENKSFFNKKEKLNATLIAGVNGVGKTTSIGKISKILKTNGNKIMLAASDTFRAAAIEQLENWANKVDVQITKSSQGSDPASVAYKAIEDSIKNNFDQVLIDTAGRLQNKKNLMEEYKKIANVTKKIDPEAPHDVILILDATSGQNVINQVQEFNKIIPITGIIMTKLDGTAKGGILLALAKKYKLPIIALGLGEKEDDLQIFNAENFADAFIQTN